MRHWADRNRRRGERSRLSLLELLTAGVLAAMLVGVFLTRILPLQGEAESIHVTSIIGEVRGALGLEMARRVIADGLEGLTVLVGSNPMRLLAQPPDNYLGSVEPTAVEAGQWYFHARTGQLRYRVRHDGYSGWFDNGATELSWRIERRADRPAVVLQRIDGNSGWVSIR